MVKGQCHKSFYFSFGSLSFRFFAEIFEVFGARLATSLKFLKKGETAKGMRGNHIHEKKPTSKHLVTLSLFFKENDEIQME